MFIFFVEHLGLRGNAESVTLSSTWCGNQRQTEFMKIHSNTHSSGFFPQNRDLWNPAESIYSASIETPVRYELLLVQPGHLWRCTRNRTATSFPRSVQHLGSPSASTWRRLTVAVCNIVTSGVTGTKSVGAAGATEVASAANYSINRGMKLKMISPEWETLHNSNLFHSRKSFRRQFCLFRL